MDFTGRVLVRWVLLMLAGSASAQLAQSPAMTASKPAASSSLGSGAVRFDIRAQLMPKRYTTVAAEIGAKIAAMPVTEGAAFKAGQVLVQLDCALQRAQLDKAEAELEGAEQTLKSNLKLEALNSVGQLELDLSKSAVNKARADVNANKAVLTKCEVLAPFSGRVAEQKVREQQYVQPGQPMLDIFDDSVLELEFLIPSVWLRGLRVGSVFQVEIDETRKTYPARFTRIGARVDPVSQSVKVAAAIQGRFPDLMAGMSGKVMLTPPDGQ